jgi:hypothetical protein
MAEFCLMPDRDPLDSINGLRTQIYQPGFMGAIKKEKGTFVQRRQVYQNPWGKPGRFRT